MTILCQNGVGGLELQTKRGDWVKFKPTSPSSHVILIGDALHVSRSILFRFLEAS
ncbi:unnamed protein product [Linum tenue]|uniref:Isopenicillin N synthase-like Fe(2+) 2OG dioxygenase domain-containing protein n=1 Tax=Linum tenue TaxID=586396 RepID=A0AAV0NGB7_9ROSI|nr:unnamed protein product [Linum tenue]